MGRSLAIGLAAAWTAASAWAGPPAPKAPRPEAAPASEAGVVLEVVTPRSPLDRAGLRAGDVLLAWERLPNPPHQPRGARGELRSPFDWQWTLKIEQAPRGPIRLAVRRGPERRTFEVGPGSWGSRVRAALPTRDRERFEAGAALLAAEKVEEASALWLALADDWKSRGRLDLAVWLRFYLADKAVDRGEAARADPLLRQALADAEGLPAGDSRLARIVLWRWLGGAAMHRGDFAGAVQGFEAAAKLQAGRPEMAIGYASSQYDLGSALSFQGDFQGARERFRQAVAIEEPSIPGSSLYALLLFDLGRVEMMLEALADSDAHLAAAAAIQERIEPAGVDLARTLGTHGWVAAQLGRLDDARARLERARDILAEAAPKSPEAALAVSNLGFLASQQGDLHASDRYFAEAEALLAEIAPGSRDHANTLNSLAVVARERGDVALAEERFRKALAVWSELGAESSDVADALHNLGLVARERGDLDLAQARFERARTIFEKLGMAGPSLGAVYETLGDLALRRGDLATAETRIRGALAAFDASAPDHPQRPIVLAELGHLQVAKGDLAAARASLVQALEQERKKGGGSLAEADFLGFLGDLEARTGDLPAARGRFERALEIRAARAGGTAQEAGDLAALAGVLRRLGEPDRAVESYQRALDILERQVGRLGGGSGVRGTFLALRQAELRGFVDLLVERGEAARAFAVLESFLARGFLDRLAARDLALPADLPAPLRERRLGAEAELDRLQSEVGDLDPARESDRGRRAAIRDRLREVQAELETTVVEIRKLSPGYAALRHPRPVGAAGAARSLPPGTLLLSFCVGPERSHLFVVDPDRPGEAPRVHILEIGEAGLRNQIERFRLLLQAARPDPAGGALAAERLARLRALGGDLYRLLLAPAEPSLAAARRLLLVPDGPLHTLPWGALVRPGRGRAGGEYLVEWKPFRLAPSATAAGELEARASAPRPPDAPELAIFADPASPARLRTASAPPPAEAASLDSAALRAPVEAAVARGLNLAPLPESRVEAERIAALFPRSARRFEGSEALEATAKRVAPGARYLHFATHVVLDTALPFNSAVVLALPERFEEGGENGLLQAWEVADGNRLSADLVVLSGCESGLGRELGGEGLQGLAQAFLHAGARSVAASLWRVSDRATAELMARFYRHLRQGESREGALRAAQVEMIRAPGAKGRPADSAYPFHWAAFQLYGAGG